MADLRAPFPYFGGKRRAAAIIWEALGDVGGYVEPFAGSAAVILARPATDGRRVETLNDADGWLVNAWRAIKLSPEDTAIHAAGPVTEIDYHARLAWLQERRTDDLVSWLEGDPEAHDPKAAGWWLYVASCGIGDPWNDGPWHVVDGRLVNSRKLGKESQANATQGGSRQILRIGDAGKGINRELPHLGDAGRGVNRSTMGEQKSALADYMRALSERLAHVRITCGDWRRVLAPSALRATAGNPTVGILLDPPYATSGDMYATTNSDDSGHLTISADVRRWCIEEGQGMRIVLCGYEGEHDELLDYGWTTEMGKSGGGAGYNKNQLAGRRERLWISPECLTSAASLFDLGSVL